MNTISSAVSENLAVGTKVTFLENGKKYPGTVRYTTPRFVYLEVEDERCLRTGKRLNFHNTDVLGSSHLAERAAIVEIFND
jgi:hypothetical protein